MMSETMVSTEQAVETMAKSLPTPDAIPLASKIVTRYIAQRRKLPNKRKGYIIIALGYRDVEIHDGLIKSDFVLNH